MLSLLSQQLRGDILLVLTLRTDEAPRDPGLLRFEAEVGRQAEHRVEVEPLTRAEQARQISDILGVPPRRELLDDVYVRAEGNPFFAEELLALGGAGDLPTTVRDLLLARLEALTPATRQVLRAASVIGRRVPHRLLEVVSDVGGAGLEEALRPAVEHHVLVTEEPDGLLDGGSYSFRHALL
jgi:predicted ATPase